MNKILIYTFLIAILFAGCKRDYLDITPNGRITMDDVFADEDRTESYLNTVYGSIPSYFWKYGFFDFLAPYSDEAYSDGSVTASWASGSLSTSYKGWSDTKQERGKGANHYPTFWTGIKDANVFLANIDQSPISNPTKKSRFKSEAQLLRAFYFWELIKEFGAMPIVEKPFTNDFDYTTLKRPTFQACVDFIVKDCDAVIANPNMPMRIVSEAERGRFSKAVAYAVKSQALLYNASPLWNPGGDAKKWDDAAVASKAALTSLLASGYQLASDYSEYFLSRSDIGDSPKDRETIYDINETPDGVFSITNSIPSKTGMFMVGTVPTQELVDSYDMKATGEPAITGYSDANHLQPIVNTASGYDSNNPYVGRDPRFYATVWYNGALYDNIGGAVHTIQTFVGGRDQILEKLNSSTFTRTGYYLRKFIDPRMQIYQTDDASWKKYRLAEIYLNLAEAENESKGPTKDAYDAINAVRARVQMPNLPTGLSKDQMRERIRRERRVELAIEEHRFWDVRRWKILSQTDKVATGMKITFVPGSGTALLTNGSFESGSAGWSIVGGASRTTSVKHTGDYAVAVAGNEGGFMEQTVAVTPNTNYTLSVWLNTTAGTGYIGVRMPVGGDMTESSSSTTWTQKSIAFNSGTNTTITFFSWWPGGATGFVDDFEVNKQGTVVTPDKLTYERVITERRSSWPDKFLIMPIPLGETAIIPDFDLNQNPGW